MEFSKYDETFFRSFFSYILSIGASPSYEPTSTDTGTSREWIIVLIEYCELSIYDARESTVLIEYGDHCPMKISPYSHRETLG
jgi:hypothetical protein